MRSRYRAPEVGTYFVTSTIINWIKIFSKEGYPEIIIRELEFRRQNNQLELYGYVIMPEHIHLILASNNINKLMQSIKSFTAKKILNKLKEENDISTLNRLKYLKADYKLKSNYQVWQEGYHPKIIIKDIEFNQKLDYIHNNPVKELIVERPEDYIFSSARNYAGLNNYLDIVLESVKQRSF